MTPLTPRTSQHLMEWCASYQINAKIWNPKEIRFAIGFYQISQGMAWKITSPVRWQSFCAAAMHFLMCASAYGVAIPMPEVLEDYPEEWKGWETMLFTLGRIQQQVVYAGATSKDSTRVSRFSSDALQVSLASAISQCFSLVPPGRREECCFSEMYILTGDLSGKKS